MAHAWSLVCWYLGLTLESEALRNSVWSVVTMALGVVPNPKSKTASRWCSSGAKGQANSTTSVLWGALQVSLTGTPSNANSRASAV
jgi:hypothetical protein